MAKRTTSTTSNYQIVKFTAFWGIIVAGIAGIITFMLKLLEVCGVTISWGKSVANAFNLVGQIAILISVILAGYAYSRGMKQGWRIAYWVFVVLAILGLLGFSLMSIFK